MQLKFQKKKTPKIKILNLKNKMINSARTLNQKMNHKVKLKKNNLSLKLKKNRMVNINNNKKNKNLINLNLFILLFIILQFI